MFDVFPLVAANQAVNDLCFSRVLNRQRERSGLSAKAVDRCDLKSKFDRVGPGSAVVTVIVTGVFGR